MNRSAGGIWILVILVALGAWLAWSYFTRDAEPERTSISMPSDLAESAPAVIDHPIAAVQRSPSSLPVAPIEPLPALHQSDSSVSAGLMDLVNGDGLQNLLVSNAVIPRIVATVDALPRKQLAPNILPLRGAGGAFRVSESAAGTVRAAANDKRYAPYLRALEGVDVAAAVDWYVRHYPLFQQAYQELGYPERYFNDRLIAVIDHLLAAPQPSTQPVLVTGDKGLWVYANPRLESLSAGQKLMLRIGAKDERMLKQKLRELRTLLSGQSMISAQPANGTSSR